MKKCDIYQKTLPCEENETAIAALYKALKTLNERTADRQSRGVEGTHKG